MVVGRRDLEGLLSELTREVRDPRAGLFGPDSMSWRINREIALLAGGGRAALLQLAHPYVAHAIEQHSPTKTDPQGRFLRTFSSIFTMLFGDVAATVDTARRVHRIHAVIEGPITTDTPRFSAGEEYAANNEDALLWVFATLIDTVVKTYSLLIEPLTREQRERYYGEAKRFGMLFGLSRDKLPPNFTAFQRYMTDTLESDLLCVTPFARDLSGFLLDTPAPALKPMMAGYRMFTSGLLPHALREGYGLPIGPTQQIAFWLEVRAAKAAISALPARLRYYPAYIDALRRMQGKAPDPMGRVLEQLAARSLPQAAR